MTIDRITPSHAVALLAAIRPAGDDCPALAEAVHYLKRLAAVPRIGANAMEPVPGMIVHCQWPIFLGYPFPGHGRHNADIRVVSVTQYPDGVHVTAQEIGRRGMMHGLPLQRWRDIAAGGYVSNEGEPRLDLMQGQPVAP